MRRANPEQTLSVTFENCTFHIGGAPAPSPEADTGRFRLIEGSSSRTNENPAPRRRKPTNRIANRRRARSRSPHPILQQQNESKPWPIWSDPLDFQEVEEAEAIARIHAAGFFMHAATGHVYRKNAHGDVVRLTGGEFRNVLGGRYARYAGGKVRHASDAWRHSLARRQCREIGYWPENHDQPSQSLNLWQGWGVEAKEGDWSSVHGHIFRVIANGDKAGADYILDWCAHMVQRPWDKPGVALVLRGQKGTGKTLLTEILAATVGRRNSFVTADGKGLFTQFNWYLADKILIGAEEAFFASSPRLSDKLKHLLTGSTIEVEQKRGDRMNIASMHRMIITSNHRNPVAMTEDERRFAVFDVSDRRKGDYDYFARLARVANGEDNETLAAFMHELKTRNIANWQPESAARYAGALSSARQKIVSLISRRVGG